MVHSYIALYYYTGNAPRSEVRIVIGARVNFGVSLSLGAGRKERRDK
jgi:hypothetical protein